MATTSDLKNGIAIRFEGELCVVEEYQHRTPGNLRAFYQVKMRSIRTGKILEHRFRAGESIDIVDLETKKLQYSYKEGENLVCMDVEEGTYEQFYIPEKLFGDKIKYLKEGFDVVVEFEGETPITAQVPNFVELLVTYTEPAVKGDTVNNVMKPATLETGAKISVPMFVNEGEKIKIDTRTDTYLERVKQ
jgi:elongation factor P